MKKLGFHVLTLLSGILITFGIPPWSHTFLLWGALVPWLWLIEKDTSPKQAIRQGIWLSVWMNLGGFYFIAPAMKHYGELPWVVAIFGLLVFSLIAQPQFLIFALFRSWVKRRFKSDSLFYPLELALVFALFYAGVDWAVPKLFRDTLGYAFGDAIHLRQTADFGSAFFITFLILFGNETLLYVFQKFRLRQLSDMKVYASVGVLVFADLMLFFLSWNYGRIRSEEWKNILDTQQRNTQVGVIQANIGDIEKIAAERGLKKASDQVIQSYLHYSSEALVKNPKLDALVWPETAYPSTFRKPTSSYESLHDSWLERFVWQNQIPLLFGGYDTDGGKDFNTLFALSPSMRPSEYPLGDLQTYHKSVLLLFGEYIPGLELFPSLRAMLPQIGQFGRGPGAEVLTYRSRSAGDVHFAPVICYEVLDPTYIREGIKKGSELILNITNDSWFGPYSEPYLHFEVSRFRSIEFRIPQVRATNTGISGLILPSGDVVSASPIFVPDVLDLKVPLVPPTETLMRKWGNWFPKAALGFVFFWSLFGFFYRRTYGEGAITQAN